MPRDDLNGEALYAKPEPQLLSRRSRTNCPGEVASPHEPRVSDCFPPSLQNLLYRLIQAMRSKQPSQAASLILMNLDYLTCLCSEIALALSGELKPSQLPQNHLQCRLILLKCLQRNTQDPLYDSFKRIFFVGDQPLPHSVWLGLSESQTPTLPPLEAAHKVPLSKYKGYLEVLRTWTNSLAVFFKTWHYTAHPRPILRGPGKEIKLPPIVQHKKYTKQGISSEPNLHFQTTPPRSSIALTQPSAAPQAHELPDQIRDFEVALPDTPSAAENVSTLRQLAKQQAKAGRWKEVVESLTELLSIMENNEGQNVLAKVLRLRAKAQAKAGELWGALADLDEAIYLLSDQPGLEKARCYYARGRCWQMCGSPQRADTDLGRCLENCFLLPNKPPRLIYKAAMRRSSVEFKLGRYVSALEDLYLALRCLERTFPNDSYRKAKLLLRISITLKRCHRHQTAAEKLDEAAKLLRNDQEPAKVRLLADILEYRSGLLGGPAKDSGAMWALLERMNLQPGISPFPARLLKKHLTDLSGTRLIELISVTVSKLEDPHEVIYLSDPKLTELISQIIDSLSSCRREIKEALVPRLSSIITRLGQYRPDNTTELRDKFLRFQTELRPQ